MTETPETPQHDGAAGPAFPPAAFPPAAGAPQPEYAPPTAQPTAPAPTPDAAQSPIPISAPVAPQVPSAGVQGTEARGPEVPQYSELVTTLANIRTEVGKAVVGQDAAVTGLVIALLCRGHVLLEGVPGVAKTLLVRALAQSLALDTKRIQFTPDLMPGDITGSLVYDARTAEFHFREGPIFTNLLLGDEINRTPPKSQSALLEAMEERQATIDGVPRPLPDPFLVIATQNPVEYEGTYPLPEAQLDRFLLKIDLPLPPRDIEIEVLRRHAAGFNPRDLDAAGVRPVATADGACGGARRGGASAGGRRGARVHRRRLPRDSLRSLDIARGLAARRHRARRNLAGLGLAVRTHLRDAGRREDPRRVHASPPNPAAR